MGSGDSQASPDVTLDGAPAGFGRYTLLDRLGAGGMADVYLALSKGSFDSKKLVVIKRPRASDHEYVGMFMDEARLAMRLNHPNVVQTYDVGVDGGAFFLAMEYLEGQPLHRVAAAMFKRGEHLSHAHLSRIAADALAGLHYAHELCDYDGRPLQIVHRDVSPHNLFVTYEGQIKVVDFGVAKATMNEVQTETGAIKGKLAYMAPEQATAQSVDRRSDVFAMGVILWELVARKRLFSATSSAAQLNKVLTMDVPPLSCEVADVHPILEAIVMRALQRAPADRYQTALEMREALESYIGATGQTLRASDVGGLVDRLFSTAREQMSTRIRAHMQSPPASSEAMTSAASGMSAPDLGAAGGDTNGPAVVAPRTGRARGEWRTTAAVLVLAVSILALTVALLVTRRAATRDPPETAAATGAVEKAPPAALEAAQPDASATAAPVAPVAPVASIAGTSTSTTKAPVRPTSSRTPAQARPIDTSFPR